MIDIQRMDCCLDRSVNHGQGAISLVRETGLDLTDMGEGERRGSAIADDAFPNIIGIQASPPDGLLLIALTLPGSF